MRLGHSVKYYIIWEFPASISGGFSYPAPGRVWTDNDQSSSISPFHKSARFIFSYKIEWVTFVITTLQNISYGTKIVAVNYDFTRRNRFFPIQRDSLFYTHAKNLNLSSTNILFIAHFCGLVAGLNGAGLN